MIGYKKNRIKKKKKLKAGHSIFLFSSTQNLQNKCEFKRKNL